jgi:uncharacterized protein
MITIADTGSLVAYLDADEGKGHLFFKEQFKRVKPPLLTCEAVVAEASYLLQSRGGPHEKLVEWLESGFLDISFNLKDEAGSVLRLLNRYADQDMQLADACVVRMSEIYHRCQVATTDRRDFEVYRRSGRQVIPLLAPPA